MAEDAGESYKRVTAPARIEAMLEELRRPGGASLQLEQEGNQPLPVVVVEQQPGDHITLDISVIREVAAPLREEAPFRLLGYTNDQLLRTPPMVASEVREVEDRLLVTCLYPIKLEVLQRRAAFRARLRLGMEVGALLRGGDSDDAATLQADLKDLSLEGCRLELPLTAAPVLAEMSTLKIELCFPDGTRFAVDAMPRHTDTDTERQVLRAGFRFDRPTSQQERQLWHFVREIERESTRQSAEGESNLLPSPLFQAPQDAPPPVSRRSVAHYATPMAKRLARLAGYLDAQLLELKEGGNIDPAQLSRYTDRLMSLHDEDREALLFATFCLYDEPALVRHCLSVAVHMLDLATSGRLPHDARKALTASAMVHDLSKALLPGDLLTASSLDESQRQRLHGHVEEIHQRLASCQWLSRGAVSSVVLRINERLDGSGYPQGLKAEQIGELSRLASVVDVVDAMRRDRPDRPARKISDIYRHLLTHPEQFDPRWVKRYIKRFGVLPIGTLARFTSGQLGWIQRLDGAGQIAQVQLAEDAGAPKEALGRVVSGERLKGIGKVAEVLAVSC